MWLWFASVALASDLPGLEVAWRGTRATFEVVPPPGLHVAPDAPVDVAWQADGVSGTATAAGGAAPAGLVVATDLRGKRLTGQLAVSLCEDDGSACRRVDASFYGAVPTSRKGRVALAVSAAAAPAPVAPSPSAFSYGQDATAAVEAAYARAKASGRPVLLDFTAVWCPPCNLLAAEVLDAPQTPKVLDDYVIVRVDVDHPSAWTLKDRYRVGGYPTLIVTGPDGAEWSRVVGYEGRDPFVAWLERARRVDPVVAARDDDPATVDPALAADVAWAVTSEGGDAAVWLARAAAVPDRVTYRLARFTAKPTLDDARWLAEHAPGRALDWAPAARAIAGEKGAVDVVRGALLAELRAARGSRAADLLDVLADFTAPAEQPAVYAAAAALIRSEMTGEPARDRAFVTTLAGYLEASGDVTGALELLDAWGARHSDEMTFWHAGARTALRNGMADGALARADRAVAVAWGDNLLRAAAVRAEALHGLGRADEARAYVAEVLARVPVPPEGLDVRTGRYRDELARWGAAAK